MKKFDGEETPRLLKVKEVSCGGHMIDVVTGKTKGMSTIMV